MSKKRRDTEKSVPSAPVFSEAAGELLDLLSAEGREHLASMSEEDQQLFRELIEDAGSELQRELLRRALAARHTSKELHAFGDQIRGMDDDEVYAAVTLEEYGPNGARRGVVQRMRAEADPIFGFTLNGHSLTGDDEFAAYDALGLPLRARPNFEPAPAALVSNPASDALENSIARGKKLSLRDLGESEEVTHNRPRPTTAAAAPVNKGGGDDVFSQAVRAFGYSYKEVNVDSPQVGLSKGVDLMIAALRRGLPVPACLGNVSGNFRRYVLFLQVAPVGKGHALQVHEPQSNETVWVNEAALRNGGELPLGNKALRRVISLVVPRVKGS